MLLNFYSVLMTSKARAWIVQSSTKGSSAGQTEQVMYVADHEGAPKGMFLNDRDILTTVLVWIYQIYAISSSAWFDQVWLTEVA